MAMSQRADLERRADALLDAASALLLEARSRRIRIEEVAARAGVGKGTVYLHWASRDHLLLAVGAREAAAMYQGVAAAVTADPVEAAPHRYLRRHFLEAVRRPVLGLVFGAEAGDLDALARHPAREAVAAAKAAATREYLAALESHRLLRAGQDPADVEYGLEAVAFGFFASAPFRQGMDPEYRADRLAAVVRRAFEPVREPAFDRYREAAPRVAAAFTGLAAAFRRTAYGPAADAAANGPTMNERRTT
ncbi:transcriptional regulator, TetR family [Glycomyces sambucus]|uniref:Transcriptional regulator, TetR family n=1 Tax=Glycomyces sambucus TaxID=380244 RepID=A0A1G9FGU4_9ACTN|nr:helix-turn-helix domain-containing protein [Glycomyces sambucus]SDK87651.1 transcriptional regulator, TetR family [Glycomyces sambucus]